jgi:aminotransferase
MLRTHLLVSDFKPAERLKNISPSGIRRFFALAQGMANVIDLSLGEPHFTPPKHALDTGCQAAKEGGTHYAPTNGVPELREVLAKKAHHDYGLDCDPNSEILITVAGLKHFSRHLLA